MDMKWKEMSPKNKKNVEEEASDQGLNNTSSSVRHSAGGIFVFAAWLRLEQAH